MPDVVHHLEHLFPKDDQRTYRVKFRDGDVFRLRQLQPSSHSFDTGVAAWLAEIVELVRSGRPGSKSAFASGDFLEIVESDIAEVIDEQTEQTIFTCTDATRTI